MENSKFQFKNPKLEYVNFNVNNSFKGDFSEYEQQLEIKTEVEFKPEQNDEYFHYANANMIVQMGRSEDNNPFILDVKMSAEYRWDKDIRPELIKSLLERNSSVLLLSYIRPIIANLTLQAGLDPIHIPFIDFSENKRNK